MNLDEAQRRKVSEWIGQGLKLSEIQNRLDSELKVRMTYMEVRLLVDDHKLTPKDPEPPKASKSPLAAGAPAPSGAKSPAGAPTPGSKPSPPPGAPAGANVSVSVDQIARAGAVVSGQVTFSDGN